jgi:DNA polymerase-3 subunit gamma/tau
MPSRPDLRDIATNVKDAFSDADRETLLDVLTFVIKEYVVEGPPPMLIHQAETLADLKGASFAQLISALQTRFDHPELAMFVVDGEQVGVRIGGVVQPLLAGRQQPPASELPRPSAGVRVVETAVQQRPAPAAPASVNPQASAPPPSRGLSVRGRPSEEAPAAPAAAPQTAQPGAPAAPGAPASGDKPESSGDDASTRFGLLELD